MKIQSGNISDAKHWAGLNPTVDTEKRLLTGESNKDPKQSTDLTQREQRISNLSLKIQNIMERMAVQQQRAAEPAETDEEAMKDAHNKENNRSGHVDIIV